MGHVLSMIFWSSLVILLYTYIVYPFLLWIVSRLVHRNIRKETSLRKVSFITVVRNEEKCIEDKIINILELEYPKDKLEIIIGSDASTDNTNRIIESYINKGVKLYVSDQHVGKVNVLSKIVEQAEGEIIVFSDARQKFERNAVKELVNNFSDHEVGCVSGELLFTANKNSSVEKTLGFYWKYEKWMRIMESKIHSMIGATGAIYAVRKELFTVPPPVTILDDVFVPLKVVEKGFRSVFDSEAIAYDEVASTSREEFTRKVRTLAGNFQVFVQCKNLFNPFRSPVAIQFFSHKLLRSIAFFFLISFFVSSFWLKSSYLYSFILILQCIFYIIALIGLILDKLNIKVGFFNIPYMFCVLNLAAMEGFLKFILGRQKVTWQKAK